MLFISGYPGQQAERHAGIIAGPTFLPKPFGVQELLARVRTLIGDHRSPNDAPWVRAGRDTPQGHAQPQLLRCSVVQQQTSSSALRRCRATLANRAPGPGPAGSRVLSVMYDRGATMSSGRGTILFVDDNDTLRRVLSTVLEDAGYQVLQFGNVTDARAALDRSPEVHVAICDVVLRGGGTSREFVAYLTRDRPDVPVLVISGFGAAQTADLLGGPVIPEFLQKPFTVEELLDRVASLMRSSAGESMDPAPVRPRRS